MDDKLWGMATTQSVSLDPDEGRIHIEDLDIYDEEAVAFLGELEETEQTELVGRALEIGLTAVRLMDTSQEVEYVERRLSQLGEEIDAEVEQLQEEVEDTFGSDGHVESVLDDHFGEEGRVRALLDRHLGEDGKLQQRIEKAFGEDGAFKQRLDEELGEDGQRIKQALDPDSEGTPTHRLKRAVLEEITQLREDLAKEEGREEVRSETYHKGGNFEDTVSDILGDLVYQTNNEFEYTGDTKGKLDRDVGDFVVTLGQTGQRIVIEAKTEYYSKNDITDEMEEALQNREAEYGIFVTDQIDNIPEKKIGWFHEFPDQNVVTVALSQDDDDDIHPGFLRMAFNWAETRAVQSYADVGDSFDADELQAELNEIEDAIGRFSTIRGQCTEIEKAKNRITEELEEIEGDVKSRLSTIEAELQPADSGT